MSIPDSGTPQPDYAVKPEDIEDGVERFLDPVIRGLHVSRDSFTTASGDVKAAHDASTSGWFGGEGNGEVRPACSSFLNDVAWHLESLSRDQDELVGSLEEYKSMLLGHVDWIRNTEERITNRFLAIHRELDERGP